MGVIRNAKYFIWKNEFNFDNCKLNRKEYGQFIADYITGEKDGFVLNIDGAWGSGKTEFLKRLYSELLDRDHPTIYIDAWESDFSNAPLTVVTSELITQLSTFNDDVLSYQSLKTVKRLLGKIFRSTAIAASAITTAKLLNDPTIGTEYAKGLLEDKSENYVDSLNEDYKSQRDAISKIRENLSLLAIDLSEKLELNLPIVVLVDELDRCRPNYAIEMLESIKHFFKTENFVFIIATDTQQLCHSIKAVYGNEFESSKYLKRFFDRKALLPIPNLKTYLENLELDFSQYSNLNLYLSNNNINSEIINDLSDLALEFDLQIRDIDQLIPKLHSCLRSAINIQERSQTSHVINLLTLLIALIEFDFKKNEFNQRGDNSPCIYKTFRSNDKNFTKKIEIALKTSVLYDQEIEMEWIGITKSTKSFMIGREILELLDDDCSNELAIWVRQIFNKISLKERAKVWSWIDYKNVVELAGNLS